MTAAYVEWAPAKINLTLRVVGRRADGYHDIESLVVFAAVGDTLTFIPGRALALAVRGPSAAASGELNDNLVLKAARALAERVEGLRPGRFDLSKRLPVAAGLGGGSADAAATLRLLARANRIPFDDSRLIEAARATGADVPVCLDPRPRIMRGIGELLSDPLDLPRLPAVLVNPGVAVPTKEVFAALGLKPARARVAPSSRSALSASFSKGEEEERGALLARISNDRNDLEVPAITLQPMIADVLNALRSMSACRLARMSGSGATCFGLFDSDASAERAAAAIRSAHPKWWVEASGLS